MDVVYTDAHLLHDPHAEIEASTVHAPYEHIGRALAIRDALAADPAFTIRPPEAWGTAPIEGVHDADLVDFLSTAWAEYQVEVPGSREVFAEVFYRPGIRRAMTPARVPASIIGRLGWYCFETTTPLTETTYEASLGAVDTALTTTSLVLDGARSAYGLCRPPGHHANTTNYGGYCFFNNAAIAAHHVAATTGEGHRPRRRLPPRQRDAGDLLRARRRAVRVVARRSGAGLPVQRRLRRRDRCRAGSGCNSNIPLAAGTGDDEYVALLSDRVASTIGAFGPSLLIVSLGLDTFVTDPICDLALTTDGFERCGTAVGAFGLPTVVLQEGGYDVDALGENARRWLTGLAAAQS